LCYSRRRDERAAGEAQGLPGCASRLGCEGIEKPLCPRRAGSAQTDAYAGRCASPRGREFQARRIPVRERTRGGGQEIFRGSRPAASGELELQAAGMGARGSDEGGRTRVLGGGRFSRRGEILPGGGGYIGGSRTEESNLM